MTELRSPATSKRYTLSQICRVWGLASSSYYERLKRIAGSVTRRGPRGAGSDEELISAIKTLLSAGGFVGEGYRKIWARLRFQGIKTAKERVRRLMKLAHLQAPCPEPRERGDRTYSGRICTSTSGSSPNSTASHPLRRALSSSYLPTLQSLSPEPLSRASSSNHLSKKNLRHYRGVYSISSYPSPHAFTSALFSELIKPHLNPVDLALHT